MTRSVLVVALVVVAACSRSGAPPSTSAVASNAPVATVERTRMLLTALAHDSMEGRRVATAGEARAARFIAARLREAGVEPAGDSGGYYQHLPMARTTTRIRSANGQERTREGASVLPSFADLDTVPVDRRLTSVNVIGVLKGSDPALASEVVVVGAHFDHIGIRPAVNGDSIANGADDDGSGTVAMMEAARIIAAGPRPKRTIVFGAFTGEESGTLGVRWYSQHPIVPLDRHVADVQVEMIGRPDTAAGGPGKAWLTGFERSTMGSTLVAAGLPVIADPRPSQSFFTRSDNIVFARLGIVAHTLSSFGMHGEYHTVNDEVELVDFTHMTEMVNLVARAVRVIADGPRLAWNPGGKP
ncbi:MAG TPA: M20/M25/M40 family metallo-hydrolase [Gemmatimonadaceae bacterium]|nr:M20/M25/M40 family metallo-hydrolase [Gemmatimonadaceae bacterium]